MKITRRPATDEDIEFARATHHAAYRELVERQFGYWDEAEQDAFFADDWHGDRDLIVADGVACGYVCIEDRADDVHVRELVVAPEFQGRGIGSSVLRDAMDRAAARGVPVRLGTARQNRALALYRRLGFRETGETDTHVLLTWPGA